MYTMIRISGCDQVLDILGLIERIEAPSQAAMHGPTSYSFRARLMRSGRRPRRKRYSACLNPVRAGDGHIPDQAQSGYETPCEQKHNPEPQDDREEYRAEVTARGNLRS